MARLYLKKTLFFVTRELLNQARAWFLRIASVHECLYACVFACVCVRPEAINN